ncbi:methyl-accepting chemotaxis protein [Siculibacillus lacustris]|uniref:Methyl-accepting chemotaxis protein n=1 Tax=Siculibacillus lacustris TaxID=1549641 RepID=A0A4Q9VRX2_9HYPH|nr:HAMP domain-containing methyl-accepting chemotaxis protein [Siculibacillus lacustris]TBW38687.1 methyl-accepting chemotaxis protein [Siculibacillus lacustris]
MRIQVATIVGVALVSLVVIGAVHVDGRRQQDLMLAELDAAVDFADHMQTLEIDLSQMRLAEKTFLAQLDASQVRRHVEIRQRVAASLAGMEADVGSGRRRDLAPAIATIAAGVKAYYATFDQLVAARTRLGLDPDSGLEGELRRNAHDIEAAAAGLDDPRAEALLLQMRRQEKDYMLRHDGKYVDDFKARAKAFRSLTATLDMPATVRAGIERAATTYEAGFLAWVDGDRAIAAAEKSMMQVHGELLPVIDAAEKSVARQAEVAKAEAAARTAATERLMLIVFGAVAVLLAGLSLMIGRAIAGPIGAMTGAMDRLAGGDLDVVVPGGDKTNEIGHMAKAVAVFRDNARERRRLEAERAGEVSRAAAERRRVMMELADTFERQVGGVVATVSEAASQLETAAQTLAGSADAASAQSIAVAGASEEATANVQSVAASTEELATTVREVGRQVETSASIAGQAMTEASEATTRVHGLSGAAERIGSIVQLIAEIAGKTNLLALNATIEAARAGDAGRGFAVVAAEVKGLADQTAKATAQIGTQVEAIQTSTGEAAAAIAGIGRTIETMNAIAGTIAAAVEEQSAATREIATNLSQAARGASDVSVNIEGVSAATAGSSAASAQVLSSARDLTHQAETLRSAVGRFLSDVRAA